MCIVPKAPKAPPPAAQRQALQNPQDVYSNDGLSSRSRRGMWASIFTGPHGLSAGPMTTGGDSMVAYGTHTGTTGGTTGGSTGMPRGGFGGKIGKMGRLTGATGG